MATDTSKIDVLNPVIIIIFISRDFIFFLKFIYKKEIKNIKKEILTYSNKIQTLNNGYRYVKNRYIKPSNNIIVYFPPELYFFNKNIYKKEIKNIKILKKNI
jgi:hypothetical protein